MAQLESTCSLKDILLHRDDRTADIAVVCKGKCFRVHLHPENLEGSPEVSQKYNEMMDSVLDDDFAGTSEEDLLEWALEPFSEIFHQIESPSNEPITLQDYLFPETYNYVLCAVDDCMRVFLDYRVPRSFGSGVTMEDDEMYPACPRFSPTEIEVQPTNDEQPLSIYHLKVVAGGNTYFFKPVDAISRRSALRELNSFIRIEETGKPIDLIRTPRLHGVVHDPENGDILGLLLSWINCNSTTLHCAMKAHPPEETRKKWMRQVSTTVKQLHEAGIIWGNATADNILIDVNDDAWVVDFGGGYTKGWVSEHNMETELGDSEGTLQILERTWSGRPSGWEVHQRERRVRSLKRRLGGKIGKVDSKM